MGFLLPLIPAVPSCWYHGSTMTHSGGELVEWESLQCLAQALSWVRIPLKPLVFLLKGGHLKKGICPSRKTSLSNAIYSNSSEFSDDVITNPTNGAQDLHENLLCIGDAAFSWVIKSKRTELNWKIFLFLGDEVGLSLRAEWRWCYWWSKFCNYYGSRLYVLHQCSTLQASQWC